MGVAYENHLPTIVGAHADVPVSTPASAALIDLNEFGHAVIMSVAFALVGIVVFALAFLIITKVTPFSIRKEIEEDQNTSLGIVIGSVLIGLSIIIASAIKG